MPARYALKSWQPIRRVPLAAADDIERYFQEIGRDWYAFGDGELARVNAALGRGEPATLSATLVPLVMRAIAVPAAQRGTV